MQPLRQFSDDEILTERSAKNSVNDAEPYAYLVEPEMAHDGIVEDVATLFLTNRECPFRCLMCDLWKNTLDNPIAPGRILDQIDFALERLPQAASIKLYNSGNFFDAKAIPPSDHESIANRIRDFRSVIVENHPRLTNSNCLRFRDQIETRFEIAMGLETVHPEVLPLLNKQMTVADFANATRLLVNEGIAVRAFILLRPPFLSEEEGIEWALKSIRQAFDMGVTCCSVVPTRPGNGLLDQMLVQGSFARPTIRSMEHVMDELLPSDCGRVFMDLWDVEQFYNCQKCGPARRERLRKMNLTQQPQPTVQCSCDTGQAA